MKLNEVKLLSKYRGLASGYGVKFNNNKYDHKFSPKVFIGLNGSGKSNLLEVVGEIFYYLEELSTSPKKDHKKFATVFGFEIKYELAALTLQEVTIPIEAFTNATFEDFKESINIKISKNKKELPKVKIFSGEKELIINDIYSNLSAFLPRHIVGYSSGMNELLSNPFIKMDYSYLKELESKIDVAKRATIDINRMYYLNYTSSKIMAIASFIFYDDKLTHLKDKLKIDSLYKFGINLKLEKYKNNDTRTFNYLPSELNLAIESFKKIDPLHSEVEIKNLKNVDRKEYRFDIEINNDTLPILKSEFKTAENFLKILYNFSILNLSLIGKDTQNSIKNSPSGSSDNLSDLIPKKEKSKLIFSIDELSFNKPDNKIPVFFKELSDGEHQFLQIASSLIVLNKSNTLFLFDEPTTHFNPEWRSEFIWLIDNSIKEINEELIYTRSQEILLTTHSPFIISDIHRENVIHTKKDEKKKSPEIAEIETYGASIRHILTKLFNQKNSIGKYSYEDMQDLFELIELIEDAQDEKIEQIKSAIDYFGYSPERIYLFHKLNEKLKSI